MVVSSLWEHDLFLLGTHTHTHTRTEHTKLQYPADDGLRRRRQHRIETTSPSVSGRERCRNGRILGHTKSRPKVIVTSCVQAGPTVTADWPSSPPRAHSTRTHRRPPEPNERIEPNPWRPKSITINNHHHHLCTPPPNLCVNLLVVQWSR